MVSLTISSAEAGPADTGAWSAPFEMGGVGIHSTLMRNGEVLIFEYVEGFYNRRRRHSGLGFLTPAQAYEQMARAA